MLSVLSLQFDCNFLHLRVASLEEFFIAFAEAVERGSAVCDRLALAAASSTTEGIPITLAAFFVSVG